MILSGNVVALRALGNALWGQTSVEASNITTILQASSIEGGTVAGAMPIVAAWSLAMLFNVLRGRRQMREGRGTARRLWYVATMIALMQISPFVAAAGLSVAQFSDSMHGTALGVAIVVHFLAYALTWGVMGPPLRWLGSSEPLPEVTGERFLSRYREVCERMGLQPPVVRMLPSLSGNLETMAYVGGLTAPSVVVTDGILHRLDEDEANSVLAHELAHIANGSLWWYTTVWLVLGPVTAVLLTPWHGPTGAIALALAMTFGLQTIVSRWFEIDCDLRGARAVGFSQMAAGLEKVYKGLPYEQTGWKSVLAMSMTSHPAYDVRMGAIAKRATASDPVLSPWSGSIRRASNVLSTIVLLAWGIGLLWIIGQPSHSGSALVTLLPVFCTVGIPAFLLAATTRKSVRQHSSRQNQGSTRVLGIRLTRLLGGALFLLGGCFALIALNVDAFRQLPLGVRISSALLPILSVLALALFCLALMQRNFLFNQSVLQALQQRRWDEVIRLGAQNQKRVADHPSLRHNIALAKWFVGRETEALADLAVVESELPLLSQAYLTRGAMFLESGEATAALAEAQQLHALDPLYFEAYVLAARAYLALGDVDSSEKQLVEADKALPDQPTTLAIRAAVAAKRGDLESAATLFDQAENLAPALPLVRLLAAEVTLEHGPIEEAERQITDAARLIHAAPLCLLQKQVQRLVERLGVETLKRLGR